MLLGWGPTVPTGPAPSSHPPLLDQVAACLADARADWPVTGRPDAGGAMIGGSVALKLEELGRLLPSLQAGVLLPPHPYCLPPAPTSWI